MKTGTGRRCRSALQGHLARLTPAAIVPVLLEPPAPPSPYIAEARYQEIIVDLARRFGWACIHNADARRTEAGVPDLLLLGGPTGRGCLWREIKTLRGKLRPAQLAFGRLLLCCGQDWRVIRPTADDWALVIQDLTGQNE